MNFDSAFAGSTCTNLRLGDAYGPWYRVDRECCAGP